jgi:hypothetical protein
MLIKATKNSGLITDYSNVACIFSYNYLQGVLIAEQLDMTA